MALETARETANRAAETADVPRPHIVTLIASATEIVCALGLRDHLVGISHECDYPPDVHGLPVLSAPKVDPALPGTEIDAEVRRIVREGLSVYRVDVAGLERLAPDLVVTQDHCEVCAVSLRDVEDALCALSLPDTRVCSLHPSTLDDVRRDFQRVADAAGVPERGVELRARFDARLEQLAARTRALPAPRVICLEWLTPPMVAGGWMPDLVRIAGGEPCIVTDATSFRTVTWDDIAAADPDVVAILPCGFTIDRTLEELADTTLASRLGALRATREGRCLLMDGNAYFNRPGPRIADSAELLAGALHPTACADLAARYAHAMRPWSPTQG